MAAGTSKGTRRVTWSGMGHRWVGRWASRCAVAMAAIVAVAGAPSLAGAQTTKPKVLTLPIRTDGPKSLDPVKGSTQYDNIACGQIYETLLQCNYLKRPLELEPLLLESMPVVTDNPDGTQTWSFKLKSGVRFHDDECFPGGKGRELVASDVFYSWKRLADPKYELENWWLFEGVIVGFDEFKEAQKKATDEGKAFDYSAPVEGFKEVNSSEFQVVLKAPVTKFRWVISQFQTSVVPREAVEKYGERFSIHPVGTGPFTCKEGDWKAGISLNLRKNPNYHPCFFPKVDPSMLTPSDIAQGIDKAAGTKLPIADELIFTMYVPDPPMWLDFQSRKLGFTQVPAEYFEEAFVKRTKKLRPETAQRGISSHAVPLLDFIFRGFNMEDPIWGGYTEKQRKIRQAINLAIDLDEMNESFYNGLNICYDGPIPPGLDGFPKDGRAPVSFRGPDLQQAKRLLAEAGHPNGQGLPELIYYTSRGANNAEQVQAEQRMLAQIGIKLNPRLVDFSELIEAVNKKRAPMFGFAWGSDYPDAENNLALFYSKNKAPGANHYNYDRPEYDAMYEKIRTMQPSPERTEIYEKMRDMVIGDAPYVGSQARTRYYLSNAWLRNFKPEETFHNWYKYLDVDDAKR